MFRLADGPGKHRLVFCRGSRRKADKLGDIAHHRDVEEAEMRHIVQRKGRRTEDEEHSRIAVDADIL